MSKEGIGYFSFDTDFFHADKKVKLIKSEFGSKGVTILIYALCAIYSDKGYYAEWGEDDCYLWSEDLGCDCSPNLIGEVINRCVKRGIFDEEVFNVSGVLTSHGIQIRFLKAAAKRERIKIIKEYALFDLEELKEGMRNKVDFFSLEVASSSQKVASSSQKVAISKQSKVKESKVNKNNMCKADAVAQFFDRIWKLYPVKKGKGQVSDTQKTKLFKIGFDEMSRAIDRYRQYVESVDYLQYQNGSTFFNSGYVDYLDANYTKQAPKKPKNSFNNFSQREYNFGELEKRLLSNNRGGG